MRNQILVTITVNLLTLIYGISVGWAAPNIVLFQTEQSPVGILDPSQISLVASLLCAGGVLGTCFYGWISDILGRKYVLYLVALPQIMGLVLLLIGDHYSHIYASRVLLGLGGGGSSILIPVFIAEISSEHIRGALGSTMVLMQNIGVLLGYILAIAVDYYTMPIITLGISVIFMGLLSRFPDSPEFLGLVGKTAESEASYKFYGIGSTKNLCYKKDLEGLSRPEGAIVERRGRERITMKDLKDPATQKGAFIAITLIILADLCGSFVIVNFLTQIFAVANIEFDIYLSTIIVGGIQIIGSSISTALVDRCGRRMLLIWSALGTGLCLMALSVYFYLLEVPEGRPLINSLNWLPLFAVGGTILISTFGVTTLPFFILAELLPVKLRSAVSTACLGISWCCVFLLLQFYQDLNAFFGIYGTMGLFAFCCFLDVGFVYFTLPETKSLTFDEIHVMLTPEKNLSVDP